jgi:uncharacterized membrane protein YfbV (UPF0208 family)
MSRSLAVVLTAERWVLLAYHAAHGWQDVVIAAAANQLAGDLADHGKGKAVAFFAHFECGFDVGAGVFWLGHRSHTQLP